MVIVISELFRTCAVNLSNRVSRPGPRCGTQAGHSLYYLRRRYNSDKVFSAEMDRVFDNLVSGDVQSANLQLTAWSQALLRFITFRPLVA